METVLDEIKIEKYPAYKDSGVEWLGEIPDHWNLTKLGTILNPVSKKNHSELQLLSITREKGVILRNLDDEEENHNFIPDDLSNYKVLEAGQFGMNKMKAWQGSYGISKHTGIVSPAYYVFDLFGNFDPAFFHLAIRSRLYVSFFGSASDGVRVGQWDLSKSRMKEIPFLVPPIEEQTAIAQFLDRKTTLINKAIAIKEKQIELLNERRQILIHNAVTRGLNPNVRMKDSGVEWIGEIPEHWEIKRLKELCKAYGRIGFRGYSTSDLVNEGEGAITISPSNIKDDEMNFERCSYLSWTKYEESPEIKIFENDILMVKTGSSYGKVGLVKNIPQKSTINPQLLVLKEVQINTDYFYELLKSNIVQLQVARGITGSTIPTISENKILKFKVSIPPDTEIVSIIKHINAVKQKFEDPIKLKYLEIEKLKEYKSSLIDSAVTGKIKVF
ncbi:MAG TPA: restriction endonuclease subunit S [Chitinophagaceae bacterium]|nr:restriction endonuclease subunit S [Chitinophagaceae bacterium]